MSYNFLKREILCRLLVEDILFGDLTAEKERAARRLYHSLQMKNSAELETFNKNQGVFHS